jgi:DNA (cytosine-5)-methyltransferase 1
MEKNMSSTFKRYLVKAMGLCKGHPRIYLDMADLGVTGFTPGQSYRRDISTEKKLITLTLDQAGKYTVCKKDKKSGAQFPVIDLNSSEALKPFEGMTAVRIILEEGKIHILPLASEARRTERLDRMARNLDAGVLRTAGAAFGGGVLDHGAHAGLKEAGISAELVVAIEIDNEMLEHAASANDVITSKTQIISAPMQELAQDEWAMRRLPQSDLCLLGVPCSGASIAGKSRRGLAKMEDHPVVGGLIASAIMLINRINPAVLVIENVTQYADTASAEILRQYLRDSGYTVHETILKASDFGCLENRNRWFLTASSRGISMSLDGLEPVLKPVRSVSEILDDVAPDASDWRTFEYLKTKELRDESKGNGFSMQVVSPVSTTVPVIRRGYAKSGSTDVLLSHPTDPSLLRPFSVIEHARIKQVPERLVAGLNKTNGHALLGQGVAYVPVVALFKRIGECLVKWHAERHENAFLPMPRLLSNATG